MNRTVVRILGAAALASLALCAACGSKTTSNTSNATNSSANTTNKTATGGESKPAMTPTTTTSAAAGSPSAVVKSIYDSAIKRQCPAIPPMLTEEFRKEVGTSADSLDALCDTFTDSGKVTSFEVKGEQVSGDTAKVTTTLTYKDGKKEEKEDSLTRTDGKWLMEP